MAEMRGQARWRLGFGLAPLRDEDERPNQYIEIHCQIGIREAANPEVGRLVFG